MKQNMLIRDVELKDADRITAIYNHYINNTTITFEETPVTPEEIALRIEKIREAGLPWLVVEVDGKIPGYAYAAKWHERSAYRFTVEPSIYMAADCVGRGLGKQLYGTLLNRLADMGIKNVLGVIALPNIESVGLHESFGFKKVGEFSDVGFKFGKWISVGYWQLKMDDLAG